MSCANDSCGVGGWNTPKPGDPNNNSILQAVPAFGGIDLLWTLPTVNPFAVAYTKIYRGINESFLSAMEIASVNSDQFFDKREPGTMYWYWIRFTSVNGTENELIGPASAYANDSIEDTLIRLSGRINLGVLATALRTEIERIQLIDMKIIDEVGQRILANEALTSALSAVSSDLGLAMTYISDEITQRTDGDTTIIEAVDAMAVGVAGNVAAIVEERNIRVSADEALSERIDTIYAEIGGDVNEAIIAAVQVEATARANQDGALAQQITSLYATVGDDIASAISIESTARASDIEAVTEQINTMAAEYGPYGAAIQTEATARAAGDQASSQLITTVQATLESSISNVATTVTTAQNTANNAANAAATAAGLIAGKGKVIIQSAEPDIADRLPQNLWIDTTSNLNAPKRWTGSAWVAVTDKAATDAAAAAVVAHNLAQQALDLAGVAYAAVNTETQARIDANGALASQITTAQTVLNGQISSAQTSLQTNINTVDGKVTGVGAMYTVKFNVNGLIGGYGTYNDGTTVQAGYDVDTFWVGRYGSTGIYPFVVDAGVTYINDAVIKKITFNKLRADDGSVIVENGKLKADFIDTANITVKKIDTRITGNVAARTEITNSGIYVYDGVLSLPRVEVGQLL